MDASRSTRSLGLALAVGGAVLFSMKAIVIKLAYAYPVNALTLQTLRMALAVPVYLAVAYWLARTSRAPALSRRQWLAVTGLGLSGYYLASLLDLAGLAYVTAGFERLVLYLYPTLVLLYGRVLFGRRIARRELAAVAVGYVGLAVVFAEDLRLYDADVLLGALLVFGSAASYAGFMVGSGRLIPRVGSLRFTSYAMTAAGVGVIAHFLITQPTALAGLPIEVYGLGAVLSVVCTILPSFMLAAGIGRLGAETVSLIGMAGPVATIYLGHVVLGEAVTPTHLVGSALILGGVASLGLRKRVAAKA